LEHVLPVELLDTLGAIRGFNRHDFENAHYDPQPVTSIRFNAGKYERFSSSKKMMHPDFNLNDPVPWCSYGVYLNERPQFTLDPLLHAGAYYVQEASSMFLWEVLKQTFAADTNIKVLDLCAAPGGKTTLLASYFKNALIVSNEVIKTRANILYENVTKWGAENVVITNNDAADFKRLPGYFDLIVVDAPCSGSGLFRKDEDAIEEWSEGNVQLCSQRQQRILADIYQSLKQDGILVYSTCSYSPEEDEDILDWLQDNFSLNSIPLKLNDEDQPGGQSDLPAGQAGSIIETRSAKHSAYAYRFWPHKVKGEGFFISALQKNEEQNHSKQNYLSLSQVSNKEASLLLPYLIKKDWVFFKQQDIIRVIDKQWNNDVALLQKNLYLKKAGVQLGEIKEKGLVPHHELALSTIFNDDIVTIELTEEQALQYLRKRDVSVNSGHKGWALCTYNNFPLGWIKILHNRVNNYYPIEWRIRKE
jgi:16S rRNA C967 or C1407 C5-methylase (RsmB/RsmF family)/NOL1/NOP2/fmu family ribosome biogenesis protein